MIRQRIFITAAICGYAIWNLCFLIEGKVPCSVFKAVTGLPCPTSGGWRSFCALLRGDWKTSLLFNPFTLVFCLLMLASCFWGVCCLLLKKKVLLPDWMASGWLLALALAWGAKFLLGPVYW